MGILTDIKVLEDGELTDTAKESFIDEVIAKAKNFPPSIAIGPADNPIIRSKLLDLVSDSENIEWLSEAEDFFPGEEQVAKLLSEFEVKGGDLDQHKEDFPQYHKIFIDGLYTILAKLFDIEAIAVLQAIGLKDPTLPIVEIINTLVEQFDAVIEPIVEFIGDMDIKEFIIEKINIVLAKLDVLIDFIKQLCKPFEDVDIQACIGYLEKVFRAIFEELGEPLEEFIIKLKEDAEPIIEKVHEILGLSPPEFPIPIEIPDPLFTLSPPLPLDLSFFGFDWTPFDFGFPWEGIDWMGFFTMELPPGLIQIIKKFLEGLVEAIVEAINNIKNAVGELIDAIKGGIDVIIEFFISKLIDPIVTAIRNAFPDMTKSIQHFATFLVIIDKVLPMAIITTIGILIGSGLIAETVAKNFGLI